MMLIPFKGKTCIRGVRDVIAMIPEISAVEIQLRARRCLQINPVGYMGMGKDDHIVSLAEYLQTISPKDILDLQVVRLLFPGYHQAGQLRTVPGQGGAEKIHGPVHKRAFQNSPKTESIGTVTMGKIAFPAVNLNRQRFPAAGDIGIGLKERTHPEFMIAFDQVYPLPQPGKPLQLIGHRLIPGINVSVKTMIELEKVAEDVNVVNLLQDVAAKIEKKHRSSFIIPKQVYIRKEYGPQSSTFA